MSRSILALTVLAVAGCSSAAVHTVMVGQDGLLKYSPDSITAAVGDQVEFHFASVPHSVAQGDEDNPCQPSGANGFYSGIVNSAASYLRCHSHTLVA
jgi:plastocyanin